MCSNLTVLAYTSVCRTIAQCEHETLHITWDIATLRLRPKDFMMLAQFLDRWGMRADEPTVSEGCCSLMRDQNGMARLWIGQVGMTFTAADVTLFVEMIKEAAGLLHTSAAQSSASQQSVRQYPHLQIDRALFANN